MSPTLALPRRRALAGAAFALLSLAGCSSSGGSSTGSGSGPAATASSAAGAASSGAAASGSGGTGTAITIKDFKFNPDILTVAPGTVITVTNQDTTTHTLTATGAMAFDTGNIDPGKSAKLTAPSTAGSYPYICTIHPFMTGTLIVS